MNIPKLLTVADIAKIVGWSVTRTRRWLRRRGVIPGPVSEPHVVPYLIPRDKLLALEESGSLLDPGDI